MFVKIILFLNLPKQKKLWFLSQFKGMRGKNVFTLQLLPKMKSQKSKKKKIIAYHIKKFWSDNWDFILNQKKNNVLVNNTHG